jgi:DNA polymerase III delta subunit
MGKGKAPRRAILLLHGEERFLVDERARATLDEWSKELVSDFGADTLEGQGLTASRLQDAILQAPFLDPYRVVYARMAAAARAEALAPSLAEIPITTRVLITVAGRLSAAGKLAKAVTAAGGTVEEMAPLKGRALSEWAARRAGDHGLTPAIAAQVVRLTPPDLSIIDSELKKLAAYKASGAKLTPEAIAELLAGGREDEILSSLSTCCPTRPRKR